MNIVLLIAVMFTLSIVHGNNQPCKLNPNNNPYKRFVRRHIIQDSFNRQSRDDWQRYIRKYRLTHRPWQSFIEGKDKDDVVHICNGGGYPLLPVCPPQPANLCMSNFTMLVYDLQVDNTGSVKSLTQNMKYVIVACDVVAKKGRPVHFKRYINQMPDRRFGPCMP